MGKETAQPGEKEFGKVAPWDVETVLSPCQECNSHATGIPSRSIPLAVRLLSRRDTTRRSYAATADRPLTYPGPTCESGSRITRLNTARPWKCRSASTFWDSDFHYPASQETAVRGRVSSRSTRELWHAIYNTSFDPALVLIKEFLCQSSTPS